MSLLLGLDVGTGGARAHGAALLSGLAAKVYRDVEEAWAVVQLREEVTKPDPERTRIFEEHYEVYRSLYPATRSAVRRLTELATTAIKLKPPTQVGA